MKLATNARPPRRRRWTLRVAVIAGVLLLFSLGAAPAGAAGAKSPQKIIFDVGATPSWTQTFHGPSATHDTAEDVVMAAGGVTYVTGTIGGANPNLSLAKLVNGVPAWPAPKVYDSPYHGVDEGMAIALGSGNTIYTAGESVGANGMPDILVVKWSSSGAVKWAKRYDGPTHGVDQTSAVVVDSAGNVTVAGYLVDATGQDWVVVSWSSAGVRRWTSRLDPGAGNFMVPLSLVVADNRSVYATGTSVSGSTVAAVTARYSSAGSLLWKKTYNGPAGLGAATRESVARPGGGVYVSGYAPSVATALDGLVMSYTAGGTRDVFALDTGSGGNSEQGYNDLAVTSTNRVVAVGWNTAGANKDCRAVSYTVDGTIAGGVTLPGAWSDEFEAVATDTFGGFYAVGTYHTAINKTAILTTRGSVLTGGGGFLSLWAPAFISTDNTPNAVAVRGSTAIVVGEASEGAAQGVDQIVLGYVY
jgi:hypothetical protein